jgi:hypothetical protein
MKKVVGLTALAAMFSAPFVFAQTSTGLDENAIIRNLESAGYTNVRDLEKDDGIWEAEATNSAGEEVELDIDPTSGNVLREEPDNDDKDDGDDDQT